ncbi:MAG: sel1 repeat family protein [Pyrinomonadaceae bacterium]|nr:sel1 repeat family protein [Pyrinomonadaceae bacterium]
MRSSLILLSLLAALLSCTDPLDTTYRQGLDLYEKGEYGKALPFISEAAEAGHKDGMAILGGMYLLGRGVENNVEKATQWLELAAGKGQVEAQSMLGIMYATGVGVARDIPEAKRWLKSASEAGDKHAIRMLQMIEGPR